MLIVIGSYIYRTDQISLSTKVFLPLLYLVTILFITLYYLWFVSFMNGHSHTHVVSVYCLPLSHSHTQTHTRSKSIHNCPGFPNGCQQVNTRLLLCQMWLGGKAIGFIEETNISGTPFWGNEAWQQNIPVQHLIKMSWHASPNRFFCVSARVYHHCFHLKTGREQQQQQLAGTNREKSSSHN